MLIGDTMCDIKCERDNVNPRLEFYTETPRKKYNKKNNKNEEENFYDRDFKRHNYDLRPIKHRIWSQGGKYVSMEAKRRSFRDRRGYWRTAAMVEREERMRKATRALKHRRRLKVKGQGQGQREVAPWKARGGGHLCQVKISRPKKYW